MIKAIVTTEKDSIQTDSHIEGTGATILKELSALNAAVIKQIREDIPTLNINGVLEVLNEMTKVGLDIFKEESENV